MIKYCTKCLLPETKPDLHIDENGVCYACRSFLERKDVDWTVRKEELMTLLNKYRSKDGSNYDCIIPVSGGKDSFYQVIKMLEYGMKPLCVNASTDQLSELGRKNLTNIRKLGVDVVEYCSNPVVRRKINRVTLKQVGDIAWPEHVTIFTIPVRLAVQFNIPLLIWGENSQNEYGGPAADAKKNYLDRRWLEEYGGLLGMRVSDLIEQEGFSAQDMLPFTYPDDESLKRVGVTGLFLGHYIPWDGYTNALVVIYTSLSPLTSTGTPAFNGG